MENFVRRSDPVRSNQSFHHHNHETVVDMAQPESFRSWAHLRLDCVDRKVCVVGQRIGHFVHLWGSRSNFVCLLTWAIRVIVC
jgi:hypothetical protein